MTKTDAKVEVLASNHYSPLLPAHFPSIYARRRLEEDARGRYSTRGLAVDRAGRVSCSQRGPWCAPPRCKGRRGVCCITHSLCSPWLVLWTTNPIRMTPEGTITAAMRGTTVHTAGWEGWISYSEGLPYDIPLPSYDGGSPSSHDVNLAPGYI